MEENWYAEAKANAELEKLREAIAEERLRKPYQDQVAAETHAFEEKKQYFRKLVENTRLEIENVMKRARNQGLEIEEATEGFQVQNESNGNYLYYNTHESKDRDIDWKDDNEFVFCLTWVVKEPKTGRVLNIYLGLYRSINSAFAKNILRRYIVSNNAKNIEATIKAWLVTIYKNN